MRCFDSQIFGQFDNQLLLPLPKHLTIVWWNFMFIFNLQLDASLFGLNGQKPGI